MWLLDLDVDDLLDDERAAVTTRARDHEADLADAAREEREHDVG